MGRWEDLVVEFRGANSMDQTPNPENSSQWADLCPSVWARSNVRNTCSCWDARSMSYVNLYKYTVQVTIIYKYVYTQWSTVRIYVCNTPCMYILCMCPFALHWSKARRVRSSVLWWGDGMQQTLLLLIVCVKVSAQLATVVVTRVPSSTSGMHACITRYLKNCNFMLQWWIPEVHSFA